MIRQLTKKEISSFEWMQNQDLLSLCHHLSKAESPQPCMRFVGGCVRDSLLGIAPHDIDVATSLKPETVMESLASAGFNAIPTGIEHGTVTAILKNNQSVEITTLRRDVTTDGRRATISYTDDWAEDARRRDFTINALYVSVDGEILDPVGGYEDLQSGYVRFIGDPVQRIREDYLRILRFFRFSARFAHGFDEKGLVAIFDNRGGINQLSKERIGSEFLKILSLSRADAAIRMIFETQVLALLWPKAKDIAHVDIERLKTFKAVQSGNDPMAALSVLTNKLSPAERGDLAVNLRLSKRDQQQLQAYDLADHLLNGVETQQQARVALYKIGTQRWSNAIAQAIARDHGASFDKTDFFEAQKDLPTQWPIPVFSISGKDILAKGVAPGPEVSKILKAIEEEWIDADFPPITNTDMMVEAKIKGFKG